MTLKAMELAAREGESPVHSVKLAERKNLRVGLFGNAALNWR